MLYAASQTELFPIEEAERMIRREANELASAFVIDYSGATEAEMALEVGVRR